MAGWIKITSKRYQAREEVKVVDTISRKNRSWNMSRIRAKDTRPELEVRSFLHRAGFRFTVNGPLNKTLPGKPDLVFPRYRTVVFVHGCFWHRHKGCKYAYTPKSRVDFWDAKFKRNIERDMEVISLLNKARWRVFTIWECELKGDHQAILRNFQEFLDSASEQAGANR